MSFAFICDAIRTPIGRYGGALATVRTDDLAAISIKSLVERNPKVDWSLLDDVVYGCAIKRGKIIATSRAWLFFSPVFPRKFPHHRESSLRLQHGRRRRCFARHQER